MIDERGKQMREDEQVMATAGGPNTIKTRNASWWAILAVYLMLFAVTGYLAFFAPDENPALAPGMERQVMAITDDATRTFMLDALRAEEADHNKLRDLALQSFNVVLGALLGFLSASAASGVAPPQRG